MQDLCLCRALVVVHDVVGAQEYIDATTPAALGASLHALERQPRLQPAKLDVDAMRRMSLFSELAPIALPALDRLAQLVKAAGVDDQGAKHDVVWV